MQKKYLLLILIALTFWMRGPAITQGLPYFYNEDEAHHFNRVVSMVKSGDYNPHYFHKPSLHFYLRMPVVALSFLWNVKQGGIKSLKEIVTKDQEGIAGYSFSASHPGIVKWNRAFSVLLGALTVLLTFCIVFEFTADPIASFIGGMLVIFSPALLEHGATIGVDVVMDFFCLLTTYLCLRFYKEGKLSDLILGSLAAGLAVSSKYNALPIVAVPIAAALLTKDSKHCCLSVKALILSVGGFLLGSPYIIKELPLFLDQFAYEIWHYKIAGHEGHTGEPGVGQAIFYTKWLAFESLGLVGLIAGIFGAIVLFRKERWNTTLVALFPILFFILMIEQRVNFTRNMLVVIPYLSIFAACLVAHYVTRRGVALAFAAALLVQPAWQAFGLRKSMKQIPESRNVLEEKLANHPDVETAVSSLLECSASCLKAKGISEVSKSDGPLKVYMDGYNRFAAQAALKESPFMQLIEEIPGEAGEQRIIQNPAIKVWKFADDKLESTDINNFLSSSDARRVTMKRTGEEFTCQSGSEQYCWIDQRISRVYVENLRDDRNFFGKDGVVPFEFTLFNPWEGQQAKITFDDFMAFIDLPKLETGKLQTFTIDMPYNELKSQGYFIMTLSDVHSPLHWTGAADPRRLGVAIKSIKIIPR